MSETTDKEFLKETAKRKKLDMRAGDTVRVSVKIEEKGKTRTQEFEGIVLARKHGNEPGATFTVRRTVGGIGVEKIFPLFSFLIDDIKVVKRAKVRQANLYHIRRKAAKEVRRYIKNVRNAQEVEIEEENEEVEETIPEKTEETKEINENKILNEDEQNQETETEKEEKKEKEKV